MSDPTPGPKGSRARLPYHLAPWVAVAAMAVPLRAAMVPPDAALSRAVPAIKVTARRRPCAIRIPKPVLTGIKAKSVV